MSILWLHFCLPVQTQNGTTIALQSSDFKRIDKLFEHLHVVYVIWFVEFSKWVLLNWWRCFCVAWILNTLCIERLPLLEISKSSVTMLTLIATFFFQLFSRLWTISIAVNAEFFSVLNKYFASHHKIKRTQSFLGFKSSNNNSHFSFCGCFFICYSEYKCYYCDYYFFFLFP